MSPWRSALGAGFETRVASRTFLLFALCVAAPIALFSLVGYRMVTAELHEHASENLRSAAKSYGLLIFSRLQQAQALVQSVADRHLARDLQEDALRGAALGPVTIVRAERNPAADELDSSLAPALRVNRVGERSVVELSVTVVGRGRALTVVGQVDPAFLWDHDAVAVPFEALCVFDRAGRRLQCTNAGEAHEQWARPDLVASDWSLFLRQSYGADDWTVRAYQVAGDGHSTLQAFGTLLSTGAALAIIGGLLLSAIQIRRSHRPLLALTEAARRIGRMRFSEKVSIDSRDEYARLGRAFNVMGSRLREQFSLLSTLARVDRRILSRESGTSILNVLVPKLPRMLGCNVAGILLLDSQGSGQLSLARRRGRGRRVPGPNLRREDLVRLLGRRPVAKLDSARDPVATQLLRTIGMSDALLASIRVDGELRGVLLVAYANARPWRHASRNAIGVAQRIAVAIRNEERERTLLQQAYYDALTSLPNRTLFRDRLHRELTQSQERGTGGALLFIDIDGFKHVNDSLGHSVGDELLASLGRRMAGCCRPADTLARLGGDEFAIIVPEASVAECLRLTESIFETLRLPLQLQEIKYVAAASVGIAMYPQDGASVELLLRNADLAMYRAKTNSRGHVQFFKEEMNLEATRRLELEHSLRAALLENGLTVHFQPIVRAQDTQVVGAEALVRWFPAGAPAIPPAQFIPIAEDTGLITRLGNWVMNEACRSLRAWRDAGIRLGYVAVNVSMRQLADPGFVNSVVDALHRHGLDGGSLEIEVTESILAKNAASAGETLLRLREHGVRVAMDDFGTGYSSMAMLGTLPIDVVKIDRSFVTDCAKNVQARALAQALIGVGHALDKEVVGEGVESDAQRRALEQMGCERMQGYLFAQPMTRDAFEQHCRSRCSDPGPAANCA